MNYPKMVFRKKDGEIESRTLQEPPIPQGWSDNLAQVKEGAEKVTKKKAGKKKVRKKR